MIMRENVEKINYLDKEIYLVKTAHISNNSVEDVIETYNEIHPDTICVELDKKRYESIIDKDKWRNTDLVKVIKDKQVSFLLVNTILSSFQKRMAKNINATSGGEMMEGIKLANDNNLNLVLADREVKTTFSRIWRSLGLIEKFKLLMAIISSIFEDEEISEEDLANLKQSNVLEASLNEVGKAFPSMKKVLVDERDRYLSYKIKNAPGNKIMAIIGAAHAKGIISNIDDEIDINELDSIPESKGIGKYIKRLIPLALIFMVIYTILNNQEAGISQIKQWILWNGSLSAIGVLIARGHILSILTAFVLAPITSLNPLLAAGWFAGIVEATLRKPKVKDFEDINNDTQSLKGFFRNNVTRILLVVVFANLFSTIATLISGLEIFTTFINIFK